MTARVLFLVVATWLAAPLALAQPSDLDAGRAARETGDHAAALARFTAAWAATGAPIARAEMAIEELALGRFALAEAHAAEALTFDQDPETLAVRDSLEAARASAAVHLGSLDVRATAGAEIRVDDVLVGSAPLSHLVRLSEGAHTIVASLDEHEPAETEVEITAGAVARVELAPRLIDRRPILERVGGTGESERTVGYAALGIGAAFLVVGGVTLGLSIDRDEQLRSEACAPTSPMQTREQRCPSLASERGTLTDVGRVTLVAGGVLAVVGVVLVLTAPSPPSSPMVACAPAFELGASCTATF